VIRTEERLIGSRGIRNAVRQSGYKRALCPRLPWSRNESSTYPFKCGNCGKQVFHVGTKNGGEFVADALGKPWPKHVCREGSSAISVIPRPIRHAKSSIGVAMRPGTGYPGKDLKGPASAPEKAPDQGWHQTAIIVKRLAGRFMCGFCNKIMNARDCHSHREKVNGRRPCSVVKPPNNPARGGSCVRVRTAGSHAFFKIRRKTPK